MAVWRCFPRLRRNTVKTHHAVALALLAGVALGGAAVEGLHAQAKPPAYFVNEINVTDTDAYMKDYLPLAQASIKKYGGKVLAASLHVIPIEGDPPKRVAIQLWENIDAVQAWRNSADYQEARKIGDKYATFHGYVVEGVPQ
jgi:uncharacterized protein (DUF1330 family)